MGKYFTCPGCDRSVSNKMLEENNNCCPYCGLSYDDIPFPVPACGRRGR